VDSSITTLNTEQTIFSNAIQIAVTVKTALATAIEQANAAKTGVTESATDPATGTKWVLPADLATFNTAISTAQVVNSNNIVTQNEVDNAVTVLNAAKDAFNSTLKNVTSGTAPVSLTFWVNKDKQILASNNSVTISKTSNDYNASFTATVTGDYDSVEWSVNDLLKSSNKTVVIAATDYYTGTYRLGVIVTKDGVLYGTEITFMVRN
jgi:hypothetical protein